MNNGLLACIMVLVTVVVLFMPASVVSNPGPLAGAKNSIFAMFFLT
jgi:hypothetical protein